MYGLTKEEKLKFIIQQVKELSIKPYEISKKTQISQAGLGKLLKGEVKNPHESTLNTIILYLEEKVLGSNIGNTLSVVNEPATEYKITTAQEKLIDCMKESNWYYKRIIYLERKLEDNSIEFEKKEYI